MTGKNQGLQMVSNCTANYYKYPLCSTHYHKQRQAGDKNNDTLKQLFHFIQNSSVGFDQER